MTGTREDLDDLITIMADARRSIVNNWDVLCSYDLKALNDVLQEEYQKNPVNSRMQFSVKKSILGYFMDINCDLQLGNPVLGFSTVQSGVYNFNIPITGGSHCTQNFLGKSQNIEIPDGYTILTSGPIRTVIGTGANQIVHDTDEIVEFGDNEQANVVLHFGDKLRNVKILPKGESQELDDLFEQITKYFDNYVKEVDYNIVQIVKRPENQEELVLTPKSFIITTQADESDVKNGALNIWIQTNESNQPKGNGQPSFYPNKNVLPVPANFTSSIFFSHTLINELYMRPALNKYYETYVTDLGLNDTMYSEVITLVPINSTKQNVYLGFSDSAYDKSFNYELDYKDSPYHVFTHDDKLKWTWKYQTPLKNFEVIKMTGAEEFIIKYGSYVVGYLSLVAILPRVLDSLSKELKLTVEIEKSITFDVIDNTRFSAKINLTKEDLKIYVEKIGSSGINFLGRSEEVNWDDIKNQLIPKLQETIYLPEIDLGNLSYFAEANILFNEERFRINPDRAIHFPYDTMVVGDITAPPARLKRDQKRTLPEYEVLASSASTLNSPINTAVKWLSAGFDHLRSYNPMKFVDKFFHSPTQLISDTNKNCSDHPTSVSNYDFSTTLILSDYVIRSLTKMKPLNTHEEPLNFLDAKAHAINIVGEFEKISVAEDADFDPVKLMSKVEKEVINGNYKNVEKILSESINDCNLDTKLKIAEMIKNENFLLGEMAQIENMFVDKAMKLNYL